MNQHEHIADHQLLAQYVAGNQDSFRVLVERYIGLVAAACRRELRSAPDQVDDATQACFLVLADKAAELCSQTSYTSLGTWLHRTARFAAANLRRKEQRRSRYEHEAGREMSEQLRLHAHDDGPFAGLEEHLDEALETLPVKTREAVIQHYLMGRPQREVAEELGCSEEAARSAFNTGSRNCVSSCPATAPILRLLPWWASSVPRRRQQWNRPSSISVARSRHLRPMPALPRLRLNAVSRLVVFDRSTYHLGFHSDGLGALLGDDHGAMAA